MPETDLLSPPTTDLTTAPDLAAALADATGEGGIDLLVVDAAHLSALADAGVALPDGAAGLLVDADDLVELTRPDASRSIARVAGVATPADRDALRRLGARAGRAGADLGRVVVAVAADDLRPLVEGLVLGGYRSARRGPEGPVPGLQPAAATVLVTDGAALDVDHVVAVTSASLVARNLANTPSNLKDPQWMVERAREVAERRGLEIEVWDEQRLAAEGFGGLLAVGGGSVRPPRLVRLTHGTKGESPHVVLVGKGITFDTGGINVKPAAGMVSMRTDMSGSAVVLSVIDAVARLDLPVHLSVLLPLAENAFGEASYRPSDVIAPYGGRRTVEVTNTDAEGRIVLADALAYADDHLEPDVLVDVATLTGAARVALARSMAALFTPDDALAEELSAAGAATGEPYWRLPLHEEYRAYLRSDVADLDNAPGKVGAVTAALFLQEFVGERRWAHLDIAGPGRSDDDTGLLSVGATGYGARTLLTWLEQPEGI
ncbi:leucyl aminopeptidase family protein [Janibacter terrae]|uniref:Probable cytosol aminopeptidase n=1 Tax=Janibacter terrae TaxID=103817 RepID=A0ABZ2FEL2_9MICO|nr:leucyl aminopeptidase family protein [Janibacter terrae]